MYVCDVTGLHYRPVLSDVSLPRLNDRRRRLKFRLRVFLCVCVLSAFFYTKTSTWSSYLKIETSSGQWTANVLGSITSGCSGKEPALPPPPPPPEGTVGRVRIPLLVLAIQLPARRFLSGINYLVSWDCGLGWWTM